MNKQIKNLIYIILLIVLIYLIYLIFPLVSGVIKFILKIFLPFIIAFILAYILEPIVEFFKKYLKKRLYAVIITLLLFVLIIYFLLSTTIPFLINEIKSFMENYESIIDSLEDRINNFSQKFDFLPDNYKPTFDNIKSMIYDYINKIQIVPSQIITKVADYFSIIVVIPMSLFYLLLDYEKLINKIRSYLIKNKFIRLKNYLGELNTSISKFIKTTFIIMLLVFILSTLAFWISGLDYPLFFGLIISVTNIIPYIGPYIGGAFPVLYALVESNTLAIVILIIILVIQVLESDVISPYLHGKNNDLHPLVVIFGIILFGKLFGLIGMIISIPIISIIKITLKYYPVMNIKKS